MRRLTFSLAVLVTVLAAAPGASAQGPDGQGTDHFVTIVARQCPEYTDITANRARNDIQESLRDLGEDTPYTAGEPIDPDIEADSQPNCSPLPNWRFTLGTGYQSQAVEGPWGKLSIVTGPYDTDVVTQPETPLLDYEGRPVGDDTIEAAVTIELTQEQLDRAGSGNSFWIQGGTTTDPILNEQYPDQYGFGALRCAIDNLNGDNVEWMSYPSGTEHVFCYAYYVTPPPTSGTIIIRKEVSDPPGADQNFQFGGNLTFNADGRFDLDVQDGNPASQTFYRAETGTNAPWTVRELVPPGWNLENLACESPGASTEVVTQATASAVINLAAGDTVTCTYTDEFRVPAGEFYLGKITLGGTGIFDFRVFPVGGGEEQRARAETRRPILPVLAQPSPLELEPGLYRVREDLPDSTRGSWDVFRVWCGGRQLGSTGPQAPDSAVVRIRDQEGSACLFVNRFTPAGGLSIYKTTVGGAGSFDYAITPLRDQATVYNQSATTRRALRPVRARGDSTEHIELGTYVIQEISPAAEDGDWQLGLVVCDGRVVPAIEGRAIVRLSVRNPVKRCGFVNVFTPDPPDPPNPPDPGPPGPNPAPNVPDPDIVISKQADRPVAAVGERVTYTVTIENRGPVGAEDVVLGEAPELGQAFASVRGRAASSCGRHVVFQRKAVVCRVGDLAAGASRTFSFETRLTPSAGRIVTNVAVVGSSTPERRARNNVAGAVVRVRGAACVSASAARTRPVARAAC